MEPEWVKRWKQWNVLASPMFGFHQWKQCQPRIKPVTGNCFARVQWASGRRPLVENPPLAFAISGIVVFQSSPAQSFRFQVVSTFLNLVVLRTGKPCYWRISDRLWKDFQRIPMLSMFIFLFVKRLSTISISVLNINIGFQPLCHCQFIPVDLLIIQFWESSTGLCWLTSAIPLQIPIELQWILY